MKGLTWRTLLLRIVLAEMAMAMAVLAGCGWKSIVGFTLLMSAIVAADYARAGAKPRYLNVALAVAWAASAWVVYSLITGNERVFGLTLAITAWVVALGVCPFFEGGFKVAPRSWKILVVAWLGFGAFVSLGNGYNFDLPAPFFLGLAGVFGVALVLLLWFRLPRIFIQGLITLMLVIAGLPLVDHLARPKSRLERHIDHLEKYYSYEAAKKDPEAYLAWANYSMNKFMEFERKGMIRKRIGDVPFWLRPNTRAMLYDSEVSINSLGFRGREFSRHKTNTYRIIALGESTTFGMTVTPDHHPWPELLEAMIRDRLKLRKPVEVINAGVPGRILPQNVYWLKHELLDFEPDMLISYHGYNGFSLLNSAIPPPYGPPPPHYNLRPLKLLADVEYHVKLSIYRRTRTGPLTSNTPAFSDPLQTSYADAYRELIDAARSRNIRLVLANFSMAVKPDSDPDIIQFYRGGFPAIYSQLKANQAHSLMVEQLAAQHPEVCFVDTHPNLDGEHDKFIDLVHFDKSGEEQMAETFFAKIKPLLEKDCY